MLWRGSSLTNDDDYLTLDEAAEEFGVSRRTLERLRQQGTLPGIRMGRFLKVLREDVRRALTFSDPIPLYRELLSASPETLVEEWMRGWIQLSARMTAAGEVRDAQRRWAEEASRRYGSWPLTDYRIRHAVDAADAASVDGRVGSLVTLMRGLPDDQVVLHLLRDIVPLLNPLISL
jgi:excisionase family DNA binding protein